MTHRLASCIAALLFIGGGSALAETQSASVPDETVERELGAKLDKFVNDAIQGGLLEPKREPSLNVPDPEPYRAPKQITRKPIKSEPLKAHEEVIDAAPVIEAALEKQPVQPVPAKCSESYALGFADYEEMRTYADLDAYKSFGEDDAEARNKFLKAMISLGLYREVRVKTQSSDNPETQAIHQLATLFEKNGAYEDSYFSRLADCHADAGLWDAILAVVDLKPGSPDALSRRITDYRYLPYHLKVDVAAMVIPALVDLNDRPLAEKFIASFSEEDIAQSPRLEFVDAILEMEIGHAAQPAVEKYLTHPDFQLAAMSTLLKQGQITSPAQREMIHSQLLQSLRKAKSDREVAVRLRFALTELGAASNYPVMMKIAELPSFQKTHVQEEIVRHLSQSAIRDMRGDDHLRKMATIDLLIDGPDALAQSRDGLALYEDAASYADEIGRTHIADYLRARVERVSSSKPKPKSAHSAEFENGESAIAVVTDKDAMMSSLGDALDALKANNMQRYNTLEPNLPTDASALTQLLETEARSGHWLVSERLHKKAAALTEDPYRERIARAQRIKAIAQRTERAGSAFQIADIDMVLSQSEGALNALESEVN